MVQDEQLATLKSSREQIADLRAQCLMQQDNCARAVEIVELELKRLQDQRAVIVVQRTNHTNAGQMLAEAWIGRSIPNLIRQQINEREVAIKTLDDSIANLDLNIRKLTEMRDQRRAKLQIAQQDIAEAEGDLKLVDERIAEMRGF